MAEWRPVRQRGLLPPQTCFLSRPPAWLYVETARLLCGGFMWFSLRGLAAALVATKGSVVFPQLFLGEETRRAGPGNSFEAYVPRSSWGFSRINVNEHCEEGGFLAR